MATVQPRSVSCVLPEVQLLHPHLFKPHAIPGVEAEPKYSTVVLLPKGYDLSKLHAVMLAAAQAKFGETQGRELLEMKKIKLPLRKQAEMAEQGKVGFSDQEGDLFFNAASESQPGCVNRAREPVLNPEKVYSGVVANVQVQCYAWQHPLSGRGLSFDLQNVQIVRDGPRLANAKPDPTKVFDELGEDETAAPDQGDPELKSLFG